MNLNNTVIKVLNKEHGAKVIEFYKKNGYDTKWFYGSNTGYHYGVYNNNFSWYTNSDMERFPLKVIELPEEKEYPKVMMVSNSPINRQNPGYKRVVFMEKQGKYLAWQYAETIEAAEKEICIASWSYAVDVPKENPQKTEMLKRVEELKSNITKMQKQVDEIQAEAEKI